MPVPCVCLHCGASFTSYPSKIRHGEGKYCSKECRDNRPRQRYPAYAWDVRRHLSLNFPPSNAAKGSIALSDVGAPIKPPP